MKDKYTQLQPITFVNSCTAIYFSLDLYANNYHFKASQNGLHILIALLH